MIDKDEELEWFDGMIGKRKFSIEAVKDEFEVYFGDPLIKVKAGTYKKGGKVSISKEVGFEFDKQQAIIYIVIIIIIAAVFGGGWLLTGDLFWMAGGGSGALQ